MIRRLGSPSGPSTLMTSAPQSPSTTAAAGAAMNELTSRTFNPASGADSGMQAFPFSSILARDKGRGHGGEPQTEFPDRADRRSAVRRARHLRSSLHEDAAHRPHRP